jgi:beta-galactosidase/beta-glucuronidase
VRVRQLTKDSAFDTNDDWSLGGIFRDVWLETMPAAAYIDRVETSTTFDDQFRDADLHLRVLVSGTQQAPYEIRAILTGPDGKEVQRTSLAVPAHRATARDTLLAMHVYGHRGAGAGRQRHPRADLGGRFPPGFHRRRSFPHQWPGREAARRLPP